ncbi:TauD/TfdA family dioxygenase [Pseudonocardia xinjiangensis]|uniref:TauD/TfdA family dioxygenase n=1 Tax=Pseudonocardia xinjiangensis TaxID=75289 RepID=UPI003D90CA59
MWRCAVRLTNCQWTRERSRGLLDHTATLSPGGDFMLTGQAIRHHTDLTNVVADVAESGIALIDGVSRAEDLTALASGMGTVVPHRDSGPGGVTTIEDRGASSPAHAGFTRSALPPHTDRSGVPTPPVLLLTACGRGPTEGGDIVLVDGRAVHDDLARTSPTALEAFRTPRTVLFGGGDGYLGSVFTHQPGGAIAVRHRLDPLVRFAPSVAPHVSILRAAIQRHIVTLPACIGAGYVINNYHWLHGRLAYSGPRLMYRVTADPRQSTPIIAGFRSRASEHYVGLFVPTQGVGA